jgi:hypothetical protein
VKSDTPLIVIAVVVALAIVCFYAGLRTGLIPCSHGCRMCGKPLVPVTH